MTPEFQFAHRPEQHRFCAAEPRPFGAASAISGPRWQRRGPKGRSNLQPQGFLLVSGVTLEGGCSMREKVFSSSTGKYPAVG